MELITRENALKKLFEKAVFIDIRGEDEFLYERIEGAINIKPSDMNTHNFAENEVVFYCKSGTRTKFAENELKKLVTKNSYILEGGINNWKKAGYSTIRSSTNILPLMQQVQIAISLFLMLGLMLSYFVSPWFNLITLFISLGLLMAGTTGFCGMAILLSKMPWNKK